MNPANWEHENMASNLVYKAYLKEPDLGTSFKNRTFAMF